ncbi:50S ribosomal protein L10 [Candidatus Dependentiae bacterium]|nr:50S ribosomal protein L10 [Candidatus Dependentiae bacterium]
MVAPNKKVKVQVFQDKIADQNAYFFADFQGLSVNDLRKLRVELMQINSSFEVVKNRLFKIAIKESVEEYPPELFTGNTAIIISDENITTTAKVLKDYGRVFKKFRLKGGFLNSKFLSKEQLADLATLPPKPDMVAQFLGMLQSPLRRLAFALNSGLQNFTVVLSAIAKQKDAKN